MSDQQPEVPGDQTDPLPHDDPRKASISTPQHGERRPALPPLFAVLGLIAIIAVIFIVITIVRYET